MNNYCTNCGKKLEKDELVCKKCDTPIVDLPYNYVYKSSKKVKQIKKILKILIIVSLCFIVTVVLILILCAVNNQYLKNSLQKRYVEPYLKENYGNMDFSIAYDSSGKCIISGDCYYDIVRGCDGGSCHEYKYLDENVCKAHYYFVKNDERNFIVTIVEKDNQIYAVEGKNIYGDDNYNGYKNNINVTKYPYESDYYSLYTEYVIKLDKTNNISMKFSVTQNRELSISGYINNSLRLNGDVDIITKYYDKQYNEIGSCSSLIDLKSYYDDSYKTFSCSISENDLISNKIFNDVVFYNVYISSLYIKY